MNKHFALTKGFLLTAMLMLPMIVSAEAGKVMFVFGQAWLDSTDGTHQEVVKGMSFDSGDHFSTAANGRVQLRMADGGLIALRPSTEFVIEEFSYAGSDADADAGVADSQDRSFFGLVKGGFRSITGAIGQKDKSAYRVRTPVATIGIRGTDYDAVFCETACEPGNIGLYVGVTEGGVVLTNAAGSLELGPGQYGYVADEDSAPEMSDDGADVLASGIGSAGESEESDAVVQVAVSGTDGSGQSASLTEGDEVQASQSGQIGFAAGPLATADHFSGVTSGSDASVLMTDDGDLIQFGGPIPTDSQGNTSDVIYSVGSAEIFDRGEDAASGIRWGRWANGSISVIDGSGTSTDQDLGNSSLHWVTGSVGQPTPVLPTTGSASFTLVGNTNPTDNSGNVGTLGSASLSADFDRQTVDADVSLSMDSNNEIWSASATDIAIDNADATFGGSFDDVTVTDTTDGSASQGDGSLSGFFTGDGNGDVSGAGFGYSLDDGQGTSVTGAAAFSADDPPGGE